MEHVYVQPQRLCSTHPSFYFRRNILISEHVRSVLLTGRAGRAVVASRIGAPERLLGARLHDAAVRAAVAALGAGVVADHGPREEPAVVAAFRELGCTHTRNQIS